MQLHSLPGLDGLQDISTVCIAPFTALNVKKRSSYQHSLLRCCRYPQLLCRSANLCGYE